MALPHELDCSDAGQRNMSRDVYHFIMPKFSLPLRCFLLARLNVMLAFCAFAMLMAALPQPLFAQEQNAEELPTPPRIGMVSGSASFWRPGADGWSPAQVNTPLAVGDAVYTAAAATIEVQIGARAYVRLAQNTMLTLFGNEPGRQQFKLSSGIAAFDLRSLPAGRGVEINTPSAAFYIDSAGYYRVEIYDKATHFSVRRGGEATLMLAGGDRRLIAPSQKAVVEAGDRAGDVDTYVAPDSDAWDQWNYTRTDDLIDAISNRYVSPEMYGTDDLDHYGNWRVTPDYGAVWVPNGMPPDWAPYSSGSWVWDPVYAWTWVDTAAWGWAPYHYGRWVNVSGFWAWAPGPRHNRPAYAPALVAFFSGNSGALQISLGGPSVSWVALGWGEPCLPWWDRGGYAGRPWWGGWAGPRVVNSVTSITYRNFNHRNAVIAMPERSFGHGHVVDARRIEAAHRRDFRPISGQHPLRPDAASFAPSTARSAMPAAEVMSRPAVGWHAPHQHEQPWQSERYDRRQQMQQVPYGNVIMVPQQQTGQQVPWARFGHSDGAERHEQRRAPGLPRADTWSPQVRPIQQQPAQVITPQNQQRHQEPARATNVPPQAPAIMQQEAPQTSGFSPIKRAIQQLQQQQQQQQQQQPSEAQKQQSSDSLPGQPANRLHRRHDKPD